MGPVRPGSGRAEPPARDLPGRLTAAAAARMPASRRDWGQALLAELDHVQGRRARWGFALGAVRVALAPPRAVRSPRLALLLSAGGACCVAAAIYALAPAAGLFAVVLPVLLLICGWMALASSRPAGRARGPGPVTGAVMACGVAACVALTVWAARRYPQPAGGPDHRYALLCPLLAVLLGGYAGLALWLPRRLAGGRRAARCGLAAAMVMAAAWTAGFLLHEQFGMPATGWAWLLAAAAPLAAGALATRQAGRTGEGVTAGMWAGLFGGLAQFIVAMTTTYGSIGWYARDQQNIADALLHGQPSAVWIVGDNLGGSIFMMIFIPMLSVILGAAGTDLGQKLGRARRSGTGTGASAASGG